jgi:hypothetical protein
MKHILNDISYREKNSILDQHQGGMMVETKKMMDASPEGSWVGFRGAGTFFACYQTTNGSVKCATSK